MLSSENLSKSVKSLALAVGFDLAGICEARATPESRRLRDWISRGYAGSMDYLERSADVREDPSLIFEGARSLIAVGLVYDPGRDGGCEESAGAGRGEIARYAGGDDYHDVIGDRLGALASGIEALVEAPLRRRVYVDTGPVQERVFASHAGLGWIGKNTLLIHPELGSYLFLGVLISDLALEPDVGSEDHCGTCRLCLDACPTGALLDGRVMDATRCISYTTIEDPGPIPLGLRKAQGDWVFGCDICQEVCPWNARRRRVVPPDPLGLRARLAPRSEWQAPSLAWILSLDEAAWRSSTRGTALRRSKRRGLLRNAAIAAGNSGDRALAPLLEKLMAEGDPSLAEHAGWALAQLSS